jgi:hypothetical protein
MARELLVALFRDLDHAEAARRDLEGAGVPVEDIDMRSRELTGFASSETAPQHGGLWELLFAREPHYRQHLDETGGALLAVRAEAAEYDRVAALLLHHEPLARPETAPGTTSQPSGVRRYVIAAEQRVPLHEEAIAVGAEA